jgi:hypothetical protein
VSRERNYRGEEEEWTDEIPINVKLTRDPCLWQPERRQEIVGAEVWGGDSQLWKGKDESVFIFFKVHVIVLGFVAF